MKIILIIIIVLIVIGIIKAIFEFLIDHIKVILGILGIIVAIILFMAFPKEFLIILMLFGVIMAAFGVLKFIYFVMKSIYQHIKEQIIKSNLNKIKNEVFELWSRVSDFNWQDFYNCCSENEIIHKSYKKIKTDIKEKNLNDLVFSFLKPTIIERVDLFVKDIAYKYGAFTMKEAFEYIVDNEDYHRYITGHECILNEAVANSTDLKKISIGNGEFLFVNTNPEGNHLIETVIELD